MHTTIVQSNTRERELYFDILRVVSIFSVVLLHVATFKINDYSVMSKDWLVLTFFSSAARFAVPVFVMISGALFLSRDGEGIPKKNIIRLVTAFAFWSAYYAIVVFWQSRDINLAIVSFLKGHAHLWFIIMILGLYLLLPFFRTIVSSKKLMRYFLLLWFIFSILVPEIRRVLSFHQGVPNTISQILQYYIDNSHIHFPIGFSGFFVLGYYLHTTQISKKIRLCLYVLGAAAAIGTTALTAGASRYYNEFSYVFSNSNTVCIVLQSVGLFVLVKYLCSRKPNAKSKLIYHLSKYSFGVYLVHGTVIEMLDVFCNINAEIMNPIISVPIVAAIVLLISITVSCVLNHIPVLNKYIV